MGERISAVGVWLWLSTTRSSEETAVPYSPGDARGERTSVCGERVSRYSTSPCAAVHYRRTGVDADPFEAIPWRCGSVVRGMTISSSPSSSSSSSISLMTSSSAMEARRRTSGDSALDNRVVRSFLSAADSESESCCAGRPVRCCLSKAFSLFGLEGTEFEGVYVLPSGVIGLKLSEYNEFCPALLLEMVLMLIIESEGATEDDPALLPVARLPWLACRRYD